MNLEIIGGIVGHVAGPVNVDWKKLIIADPEEDEIGAGHLHVLAGVLGHNGLPMVVKCQDPDCNEHAIMVDEHDGGMVHN